MAEFPPNLDDGELWLPSDIFLTEVSPQFHPFNHCPFMDASFPPRIVSPPPLSSSKNLEGFKWLRPPVRDDSISNSTWLLGLNRNVQSLCGSRTGLFARRPELLEPGRSQVDEFQEMGRRVLQSQQNRFQNRLQNCLLPFQGNGFRGGGFVRESAGTGVFHPRATATSSTVGDLRKELGVRNNMREVRKQRNWSSRESVVLPGDWTY